MRKTMKFALMVLAVVSSGCASVPMAPLEADTRAKTFTVDPGKSNIYVYRNESIGGAVTMTLSLDGRVAGKSGAKTYFLWVVEPGEHEIQSLTENTSVLKIEAVAGKNHYVWQEVKMGAWSARSLLHEVSEQEGRAGVNECKLAASLL